MTLGALCLASLIAVTNHAGHVVRGELTSVTNGTFTVAGRTYPLSVLPPSEQLRVKAVVGLDVRTPKQKRIDTDLDYEIKRIDARVQEGEITEEEGAQLKDRQRAAAEFRRQKTLSR